MGVTTRFQELSSAARAHLDELLDQALEETFPASDPIAVAVELQTMECLKVRDVEKDRNAGPMHKSADNFAQPPKPRPKPPRPPTHHHLDRQRWRGLFFDTFGPLIAALCHEVV